MSGHLIHEFNAIIRRFNTTRTSASSIATATTETWDLSGVPLTLLLKVDGGSEQTITFIAGDFADTSAATATEVSARINASISGGESYVDSTDAVIVATTTMGDAGSIEITGGTANSILLFPVIEVEDGGFDEEFGALRPIVDGTQEGKSARREGAAITLRCQVDRNNWGDQDITAGGLQARADIVLTVEMRDLRNQSLIDSNGEPLIEANDRLERIERKDGAIEWGFPNPPGMWVHKIEPAGYGLSSKPEFNVCFIHFSKERQGV